MSIVIKLKKESKSLFHIVGTITFMEKKCLLIAYMFRFIWYLSVNNGCWMIGYVSRTVYSCCYHLPFGDGWVCEQLCPSAVYNGKKMRVVCLLEYLFIVRKWKRRLHAKFSNRPGKESK